MDHPRARRHHHHHGVCLWRLTSVAAFDNGCHCLKCDTFAARARRPDDSTVGRSIGRSGTIRERRFEREEQERKLDFGCEGRKEFSNPPFDSDGRSNVGETYHDTHHVYCVFLLLLLVTGIIYFLFGVRKGNNVHGTDLGGSFVFFVFVLR